MTKQEHVDYWKETAEQDWSSAQVLFGAGNYLNSLFLAHLVIEKLSKALWVQDNTDDYPPRIHNITRLLAATTYALNPAEEVLVAELNQFQMEGRYPDYARTVYQRATASHTQDVLHDTATLRQCLLNKLL
ncbi:HEPN domain-containing protein [Hymenobacter sp. BT186]|uniref:HEPN domain-containing protein n=1 Tax=Hymenobacter telluris TaxID=2816474 RepID=A0A939JAQ7_9BACT|nr:HEPN domain-containing protein [Hymenobacter telluris]MBO0358361.1 HEPN domain-containing protein [Hymenobacter telluris]MBW3374387.1 HEPN domain-containing protein [Hymenobacter norwichensis]